MNEVQSQNKETSDLRNGEKVEAKRARQNQGEKKCMSSINPCGLWSDPPVARGCSGAKAPQLAARPYVVRHGGTWALNPDSFLLRVFFLGFFVFEGIGFVDRFPHSEWTTFPPLVAAVLITPGAEPPGSHRIGVIGVLVYFLPPETVVARGDGALWREVARPLDRTRVSEDIDRKVQQILVGAPFLGVQFTALPYRYLLHSLIGKAKL